MIIETVNGSLSFELKDVVSFNKRKVNYKIESKQVDCDLTIIWKDNQMTYEIPMKSESDCDELIQKHNELSVIKDKEVEPEKTYVDGFKDGCEYTLKLKDVYNAKSS